MTEFLKQNGAPLKICGYACLFDATIKHREQSLAFARGAFSPTLLYNASGVRALVDHKRAGEWACTRDGSLRVWEDGVGLGFSAMIPNTIEGRGLARAVADGYIGASLHFRPFKTEEIAGGYIVQAATLTEISLTTRPAFATAAWLVPFESMNHMPDHALALRRRLIGGQLKAKREAGDHVTQSRVVPSPPARGAPSRAELAATAYQEAQARRRARRAA